MTDQTMTKSENIEYDLIGAAIAIDVMRGVLPCAPTAPPRARQKAVKDRSKVKAARKQSRRNRKK